MSETVMLLLTFWVPVMVASCFGASLLTQCRGRSFYEGFAVGLVFGAFGLFAEALLPSGERRGTSAGVMTSPRSVAAGPVAHHRGA
jgi:hypothetical protein